MSLDGTIKRPDGRPLGGFADVQSKLGYIFPGVALQRSMSGLEMLQAAEARGVTFPAVLREHMVSACQI